MSTEEGRSRERSRRIALTALASLGARSIAIVAAFISIPLTVDYLGAERYGLWMTIAAFTGLFGFLDLGVGSGLINVIADAYGRHDQEEARSCVSSALIILGGVGLAIGVIFAVIYPHVSWGDVFNVDSAAARNAAGPTTLVLMCVFVVSLPLSVVTSIQLGYQEGFRNSMWVAGANALSLVALLVAIRMRADLPWLVAASVGVLPVAMLINGLVVFRVQHRELMPRIAHVTRSAAGHVMRLGSMYLALGVAIALGYQTDTLVIARLLGAERVPEYTVPLKLFFIVPTLLGFVFAPLWPAYGESIARGDTSWARSTLRRSLRLSAAVNVPAAVALTLLGPWILHIWVGPEIPTSGLMMVGLGVWAAINTIGGPYAAFLNGAQAIRFQAVVALLMCVVNLGLSIFLVQAIGPSGVVYGSTAAQVLVVFVPSTIYIRRLLNSWTAASMSEFTTLRASAPSFPEEVDGP
jgi:O-antigen/teichoic acid export membrane protein